MVGRHLIGREWVEGRGSQLVSIDPATGRPVWHGRAGDLHEVDAAVGAARDAFERWEDQGVEGRTRVLEAFAGQLKVNKSELAELISLETGKPLWESDEEVAAMAGKLSEIVTDVKL